MGSTFSRTKTWIAETLTASDLNAEFDNILNNLTPAGLDDESASDVAMQAVADPYPGSVISKPTSLTGELQRIRYLINQITGNTYWYEDPAVAMTSKLTLALGAANLKAFMNAAGTAAEWANGIKAITASRDMAAASGDVAYTGAGFKPSAVIAIAGMDGAWNTVAFSVGWADASLQALANTGSGGTGFYVYSGGYFIFVSIAAGAQYGVWKSFDADGFTVTWTKSSTPTGTARVHFLCLR